MHLREFVSQKFKQGRNQEAPMRNFISHQLTGDRQRRRQLKRCLSLHVGSRWYRAPEVALIERQYDQASDIWSFGCILYEIIKYTLKTDATFDKEFQRQRYLFQGSSCYPLSPCKPDETGKGESEKTKHSIAKADQIKVILRGLGP